MKLRDVSIIIILGIVAVAAVVGIASSRFLGEDNAIEEQAEKIIEDQTGWSLDLTPNSPEEDK